MVVPYYWTKYYTLRVVQIKEGIETKYAGALFRFTDANGQNRRDRNLLGHA